MDDHGRHERAGFAPAAPVAVPSALQHVLIVVPEPDPLAFAQLYLDRTLAAVRLVPLGK